MKITVRNLGPIREEAQFELKPLTIFIGPNNSGKTWLAYTLAAVFGQFGIGQFTAEKNVDYILNKYPPVAEAVETLLTTGLTSLNIYQFAATYAEQYLADVVACVREKMSNFMGTGLTIFNDLEMAIDLNNSRTIFMQHIFNSTFQSGIVHKNPNTAFSARKKKGREQLDMYITIEDQVHAQIPHDIIQKHVVWYVFSTLHHALFSEVITQPIERIIPPRVGISYMTRDSKYQITSQSAETPIRSLSSPVGRHISFVADIILSLGSADKAARQREAEEDYPQIQRYMDLAQLLEERILNGKVYLSTPEPAPGREILFHPNDCPYPLELSLASSMVKELALLVFYLRSFAKPNELLILGEPEMNLHPKAQMQMIELLSILANADINVIVTTHSPYITDHLLNLTKAKQHPQPESIASKFVLQDQQAFIDEKNVSLYLIDQGKTIDANAEDADWNTFGKASDIISDIYFSL